MPRFTLDSIAVTEVSDPPRLVIYGTDGVGKSTFAAHAPSPIFIPTEGGISTIRVPAFPIATEFSQVLDALTALSMDEHPYQTVVLDSLDWLERLIHEYTAREKGKDSIEDLPYGRGFTFALEHWRNVLRGLDFLRGRGMTVICIAHAEIKRFDAPDSEPYERYQLKLHKGASALLREWADVVGFAHREVFTQKADAGFNKVIVRGVGSGTRLLALDERPSYHAKNRYSLPEKIPLSWQSFVTALAPAYAVSTPIAAPAAPIETPIEELASA